jgi:hypothetical protein
MISTLGNHTTLEMGNRYFTPIKNNQNSEPLILSSEIDPHGYMAKAAAGRYVHCEENVVRYYTKEKINKNHYRYFFYFYFFTEKVLTLELLISFIETNPSHFRVGDIVEVEVSFLLVPFGPIRDGYFKSSMVLRGIALLDETVTQVSHNLILRFIV